MTNREDLLRKIGIILSDLNNQYDFFNKYPQQVNELELALFHANADFLVNHVQILAKISSSSDNPVPGVDAVQAGQLTDLEKGDLEQDASALNIDVPTESPGNHFIEERQPESKAIDEQIFKPDQSPSTFEFILNEKVNAERFEYEEKAVDELFNRPLSQEEENILAQKRKLNGLQQEVETDEDEIGPEPFLVSKDAETDFPIDVNDLTFKEAAEPQINDEKVLTEDPTFQPTLNELLAAKVEKSLNSTGTVNKLADLKQGINLNDKLLYIKDLFNGYNLAYAEAIDLANKLPSFDAADNFFKKNYAIQNNWADKQSTVDKFYAVLNQRFQH